MSRLSSVLFGSVVVAIAVSASACTVTAQTQDRFTESNYVLTDTAQWAGETININIAGVPIAENGGVTVIADPAVNTITANARLLAMANTDDKASADLTTGEVKNTFAISRATPGEIDIACGHGSTHGSSDGGKSGCELVEIHVPIGVAGDATHKLNVKALSGNGKLTISFGSAANVGSLTGNANGAGGDIDITAPSSAASVGATISFVSEQAGDINATLPTAFAADHITIEADPESIDKGPFTDIGTVGGGAVATRGTAGTGLASLNLVSTVFAGTSGKITLAAE